MDSDGVIAETGRIRREKGAPLLAHNYQPPEIRGMADFVGDSLDLSRRAADLDCETIVFCGVDFMAETAKILSPEKKVLIPRRDATCPDGRDDRARGCEAPEGRAPGRTQGVQSWTIRLEMADLSRRRWPPLPRLGGRLGGGRR